MKKHPKITFAGKRVEVAGADEAILTGELTIRGVTRTVPLRVRYLGQWPTPCWENGVDKGPKAGAGFSATAIIFSHNPFTKQFGEAMEIKPICTTRCWSVIIQPFVLRSSQRILYGRAEVSGNGENSFF